MYKLTQDGGVIEGGKLYIPNDPKNRHRVEFEEWIKNPENVPEPADLEPVAETPEPSVSELIEAIEGRDRGDSAKWDEVKSRKRVRK